MIFGESRLKDMYRRVVWGPGREALESLPPAWEMRAVRAAARVAGRTARRGHLDANLARAFPDRTPAIRRRIAQDAFAAHFSNQYASFSFGKCDRTNWAQYLRLEGLQHLEAAAAQGRGVVLMHPHMGPAQLPLHVLGVLGWPMHQIGGGEVTLVELSDTGRWAAETRARLEQRMPVTLHDGKRFLRPVLRALKEGGVVMTACDATGGGSELGRRHVGTVLGQPMPVPVGPAWLAYTGAAPLLTIHCYRERQRPGPPFTAVIGPTLPLRRDAGRDAALADGAAHAARFLDRILRDHPGDWLFWDGFAPGGLLLDDGAPPEAP